MKRNRFNRDDRLFDAVNTTVIVILLLVFIYPIYFTIIASVSDPFAVVSGRVSYRPVDLTIDAYRNVFKNSKIWIGYRNTIFYTLAGTALSLFLTIPGAYVLSKKKLPGRALLTWFCLIPMYFGGGLVPTFLNVKQLGLFNKPYTLIILGSLSVFNVIVTRVFFETSIPGELYESARIDGASEIRTFSAIALPLAAPIIAVMALFYGVGKWNDYFTALLYLANDQYHPLQLVLRGILIQNQSALMSIDIKDMEADAIEAAAKMAYMAEAMKYALIFIASAPLLAAYPFVQKYFVKGVMIGSLKG